MDYSKEFKKYATKHHGVSSTYYDKIISSMTPYIIEETIKCGTNGCFFKINDGQLCF